MGEKNPTTSGGVLFPDEDSYEDLLGEFSYGPSPLGRSILDKLPPHVRRELDIKRDALFQEIERHKELVERRRILERDPARWERAQAHMKAFRSRIRVRRFGT